MFHIWAGLEPAGEVTGRTSTSTAGSEEMPEPVHTPCPPRSLMEKA